jgi:hypothetical protein
MLTQAKIDQFYKDVEALGLKFPGAAIRKATGFSKGTISEYLNKVKEPSEGFLKAFYAKFPKSSQNVPRETQPQMAILSHEAIMKLIDSNKILAEANADIAAAHKQLAADQHAIMLKLNLISQPVQDPEVEILLHSVAELLLKVGVSAKAWETVNAGQKELSKLMSGKIPERKVVYKKQGTGS